MTQPIQEPTTQRAIAGSQWGISQLARRPAPVVPPGVISQAWIVHFSGSSTVTHNTAFDVTVSDGPYDEGFVTDSNDANFSVHLTNGYIQWNNSYTNGDLLIIGAVQLNSDLSSGTVFFGPLLDFGIGGTFGGGNRTAATYSGKGTDSVLSSNRWSVTEFIHIREPIITTSSVRLLFWQNSAGNANIESLMLTVFLLPGGTGTIYT